MFDAKPLGQRGLLAVALTAAVVVAGLASPGAAAVPPAGPHLTAAGTVPVYSYAQAIRESVWVQSPLDSDGDGARDRIAVDLVRPRETAAAGTRVPVVMVASPYYLCCGRGSEGEVKEYGPDGTIAKFPMHYDNYFVPRGYAFVAVDLTGTSRSTGCADVGGPAEVAGAKAVIDWLNGRAVAYTGAGAPVTATGWTNGKVGMIGKSWDGSVANGVAATGVAGLETIVPISAISSWYDYQRANGILRADDYPGWLHEAVTGRPADVCADELAHIRASSAESTGNYNTWWAERDYRAAASRVRASVFVAHGLNDYIVLPSQFGRWWDALAQAGVSRKIWLYQAAHEDPFDVRRAEWVDVLHRWFDHELYAVPNGIETEPRATLETAPGVWRDEADWPAVGARTIQLRLGEGDGVAAGTLGPHGAEPGITFAYQDNPLTETELVSDPGAPRDGRVTFVSGALSKPLRISGTPSVRLRIAVDRPTTHLSARLVDYGTANRVDYWNSGGIGLLPTESCWGESTAADDACYMNTEELTAVTELGVLSRGFIDAAHHTSLSSPTPLQPGRWYTINIPLETTDATIPAGHRLGLILNQSDPDFTNINDQDAIVTLELGATTLQLPVAGEAAFPADAAIASSLGATYRAPVTVPGNRRVLP